MHNFEKNIKQNNWDEEKDTSLLEESFTWMNPFFFF